MLHLILGNTVDTVKWIKHLESKEIGTILCLDYDLQENEECRGGYTFISAGYARWLLESEFFDSVKLYKSFYKYPLIK